MRLIKPARPAARRPAAWPARPAAYMAGKPRHRHRHRLRQLRQLRHVGRPARPRPAPPGTSAGLVSCYMARDRVGNGRQSAATWPAARPATAATGGELDSGGGECSKFFEPRIRGRQVRIGES